MRVQRIAVLMTCYNRKDITLKSIEHLMKQIYSFNLSLSIYLVDDGSVDGTNIAIREKFPTVIIIQGCGALYWNGGMRLAWEKAEEKDYDFYLWLNDDTLIFDYALNSLLITAYKPSILCSPKGSIIVGSCYDPFTKKHNYGGRNYTRTTSLVAPLDEPLTCDTMNGNIVLIPKKVFQTVGFLDNAFTHSMGDIDYGLRAKKYGIMVWVAPGFLGTCPSNQGASWTKINIPIIERWKSLHSPKGLPPSEYLIFLKRHNAKFWYVEMIKVYLRVLFPQIWKILRN